MLRLPSPAAPPGSGLPAPAPARLNLWPQAAFLLGALEGEPRSPARTLEDPRQRGRMVRFWGCQAQADVAQSGSSLSVVVVCNHTWAFAPLPRPEVQVEIELLNCP